MAIFLFSSIVPLTLSSWRWYGFDFRRALDYILFTSDQVHLLPGYPGRTPYLMQIRVAIYVQFPPGVSSDSPSTLDKNILLTVINSSRENLEKALNVSVVNLKIAYLDPSTDSSFTETPKVHHEETTIGYFIIGGAAAGVILAIILCVLGCCRWVSFTFVTV